MLRNRSSLYAWAVALALVPVLGACGDDPLGPQDPEDVKFAASLGIDLEQMTKLESGVYILTTTEGAGPAITVGEVEVLYKLWLPDGTLLQESPPTAPLKFTFGQSMVIPGFEDGVKGMRVGEVRKMVIPSDLGYGSNPPPGIPNHAVLVFEVQLLSATQQS